MVIGQADFIHGDPNRGGATPAANTISDPSGNPLVFNGILYLPDLGNARVLGFTGIPATGTDASANFLIGQTSYDSATIGAPSATTMAWPQTVFAENSRMFLVDYAFNRVTIYNTIPTSGMGTASANVAVGQINLNTADYPRQPHRIQPDSARVGRRGQRQADRHRLHQ